MARRISELEQADYALQDWAAWCIRNLEKSAIGFAPRTAEAKILEGMAGIQLSGYFHSREPNVMMPPYIAEIDRAVNDAPACHQQLILARYFLMPGDIVHLKARKPGKPLKNVADEDRARVLGVSKREYYRRVDNMLWWYVGKMGRKAA